MKRLLTTVPFLVTVLCMGSFSVFAQGFKCEDHIRITHVATGANLHSHQINYSHPNSSQQQQVTAFKGADFNDVWVIQDCTTNPVKNGDQIRLQHLATKKYLHSHPTVPAPLTQSQQEVTGWIGKDQNDLWKVEVDGGGVWRSATRVRLIHIATNAALHSHNITGGSIPANQQEVTAYSGRDENDLWMADAATDTPPPPTPKYPWANVFEGDIQHSDVWSKLTISNNGRLDYEISIKNRDRVSGSCVRFYIILADVGGNIMKTLGGDQFCVDGRLPVRSRSERGDRLTYTISADELSKLGRVEVVFSPGGKNFLDQLKNNLQQVNEVLKACPECVKTGAAVAAAG